MSPENPTSFLFIPNDGDLQRELRPFVFFSEDYGGHQSEPGPPNLWAAVRMRDVVLSEERHQERLHLDHAIQNAALSVPGRVDHTKND